ncbi:MAG: hypothetical protein AB7O62_12740 [Pirellulales bacterium]
MRKLLSGVAGVGLMVGLLAGAGCNGQPPPKGTAGGSTTAHGGDDGDGHAEHGHGEHGHPGHDHPDMGPHHGQLIELGNEEYHAELVHDDEQQTVTIYLLDDHAKGAVSIDAAELTLNLVVDGKPAQFKLQADPQSDDAEGESSRFASSDAALAEALDVEGTSGRLNVKIGGKSFVGSVDHHHDDHE